MAAHLDLVDGAALVVLGVVAGGVALALGHDYGHGPRQTVAVGIDHGELAVLGAVVGFVKGGEDGAVLANVDGGVEVVGAVDAGHAALRQGNVKAGVGHAVAVDPQVRAVHLGVAEEREGVQNALVRGQVIVEVAGKIGAGVSQNGLKAPVAQIVDGSGPAGDVGAAPAGELGVVRAEGVYAPLAVRLGPQNVQLVVGHKLPVGQIGVGSQIQRDRLAGLGVLGVDQRIGLVGVFLAAGADVVPQTLFRGGRLMAVIGQTIDVRVIREGKGVELADIALFLGREDEIHCVDTGYFLVHHGLELRPGGTVRAGCLDTGLGDGLCGDRDLADLLAFFCIRGIQIDCDFAVNCALSLADQNGKVGANCLFAEVQILKADFGLVLNAHNRAAVLGVRGVVQDHIPVVFRGAAQGGVDVHGLLAGLGEHGGPQVAGNVGGPGVEGVNAAADGGGVFRRLDHQIAASAVGGNGDLLQEALTARAGGGVTVVGQIPLAVDLHKAAVVVAPAGDGVVVLGDFVGAHVLAEEAAVVADDAAPVPAGEVLELIHGHIRVGVDVSQRPPALLTVYVLFRLGAAHVALIAVLDHPVAVSVHSEVVDGAALIVLGIEAIGVALALGHFDVDLPFNGGALGVDLGEHGVLGVLRGCGSAERRGRVEGGEDGAVLGNIDGGVKVVLVVNAFDACFHQGDIKVGVGHAVAVGPKVRAVHLRVAEERESIQNAAVGLQIVAEVTGKEQAGVSQNGLKAPVAQIIHGCRPAGDVRAAPAGELGVVRAHGVNAPLAVLLGPHDVQLVVGHELIVGQIGVDGVVLGQGLAGLGVLGVDQGIGLVAVVCSAHGAAVVPIAALGGGGLVAVRGQTVVVHMVGAGLRTCGKNRGDQRQDQSQRQQHNQKLGKLVRHGMKPPSNSSLFHSCITWMPRCSPGANRACSRQRPAPGRRAAWIS